jgi:nitroreductase/NAD-dependent dihydropyrimidine dehydrogenase PreA subunit
MIKEFYISESCSNCGTCVQVCPALVLTKNASGNVCFNDENLSICLECGQCMAVCRTKSVHVKGFDYDKDFFELSNSNDFLSIVENRRSVRRFKPLPLKKEEIEKILYILSLIPHGDSHHHVEISIINNRDKIMESLPLMQDFYKKLGKWLHNPFMCKMIKFKKGAATIKTLKNHLLPRIEKGVYQNTNYDYDGITRGAHTLMIFHAPIDSEEHVEDSYIMATYTTLAAQSMGIGSTIVGLVPAAINKTSALRRMFNIPDNHEAVVSVILGYPQIKYRRGIKRNLKKVNWID